MTTQTLLSSVGLLRYVLPRPPPPQLTSTPAPLPVPNHHNKTTHRIDMPLPASCSSNPVHGSRPLKHGFRVSGAEDTPFRVHHPHLHSHSSTCPQHVATRHDKTTHCRHMPLSASRSSDPGYAFRLLKHCCHLSGCGDIPSHVHHHHTSPPLPHLYLSRLTRTQTLIGWTCRFHRRVDPVL